VILNLGVFGGSLSVGLNLGTAELIVRVLVFLGCVWLVVRRIRLHRRRSPGASERERAIFAAEKTQINGIKILGCCAGFGALYPDVFLTWLLYPFAAVAAWGFILIVIGSQRRTYLEHLP
jgi:hypothetical protein